MLPDDISLEGLRTLKTDAVENITKENVSKASLYAEQQKNKESLILNEGVSVGEEETGASNLDFKKIIFTLLAVIVIFFAGYGILRLANERGKELPVAVDPLQKQQELISFNTVKAINFTDEEIVNKELASQRLRDARTETEGITHFKTNIPFKNILSVLSFSLPTEYLRSIEDKGFFGGLSRGNFFILKFDSYETAFAGQLAWEPLMQNDLFPFFNIPSTATLSRFEDRIVGNRDVRVAEDTNGTTLFLYGFYNRDTIIFAQDEVIFTSIYEMLLRQNL